MLQSFEALMRLLEDSGDITPQGVRQVGKVAAEEALKARGRFETVYAQLTAVRAENERLRAALDELNTEYEGMFNDAAQEGIEKAKSYAIRGLRRALAETNGETK